MNALQRLRAEVKKPGGLAPLRVLAASGQLGYGVPEPAFSEGLKRKPHFIGADMGSIDPGPYYLGSGELATSDAMTRDALLGTLEGASFVVDSMNPLRNATPMSVAAHSLYEQGDPYRVHEPEGTLHVDGARYEAVDAHRCRVSGARWEPAESFTVKIEGATRVGERAVLLAGCADPRAIAAVREILPAVERTVRDLVRDTVTVPFELHYRVYGVDGVVAWPAPPEHPPREVFVLVECT